ncbi:MAG: carboxypeptidase regulatory-like domain-containing protein, partial [Candidatus Hatepunaea meridiana]|nr:carboxypeptidase regulatory-like domain-containing protein [Candidatus Hatepunaea meridiana]
MKTQQFNHFFIISMIIALCIYPLNAEVNLTPFGVIVSLEANEEESVEMILTNDGESDVSFEISFVTPEMEEQQRRGPRRDDFGDILEEFDLGEAIWNGLAWDGELMWGITHEEQMIAVNLDGEIEVENVRIPGGCTGLCWDGEAFWLGSLNEPVLIRVDNEGDELSRIRIQDNDREGAFGVAWDGENLWYICPAFEDDQNLYNISVEGENIRNVNCGNVRGAEWASIVWVPEHEDGHMWLLGCEAMTINQLNVEEDQAEVIQQTGFNHQSTYGIGHDTENLWCHAHDGVWFIMDDGIAEPKWIVAEPQEGVIQANDEESFDLLFNTEEMEEGVYEMRVLIELAETEEDRDQLDQTLIEISAVLSIDADVAAIIGTITDAATDEPVSDVRIDMDRYIFSRFSDDEGNYSLQNLPPGEYELTFTAPDYLPTTEDVEIEEDDVELNVELLHSECTPSEDEFFMELNPDMEHIFRWEVINGGNGPLVYRVERQLIGDANADPWELRETQNAEETAEDDQINGVIFAADHYFVSGGNNREDDNKIYVFNRDGELVREFDQFHQSDYGIRDLCWDGELIWGSDEGILYGFDTDGELIREIEGEADSYRSLTYDPEGERFISANITSDIYISDRDGHLTGTIDRPGDLRTYGLAYWSDDPDGYNLYAFGRGEETDLSVSKVNLENGDFSLVTEIDGVNGRPGGICITNTLDIYSWVFIGVAQNPDRIAVCQLEGRREWFQVDPEEGEIAADGSEAFTLTLNSADLPPDNRFEGELVFTHDGVGGQTVISVALNVVEGEVHTFRELDLDIGWNMVSVNLQPDEEDVEVLMADLVEAGSLIMMKDGDGHFYRPDYNFNNIPGWSVNEGYQVKMRNNAELRLIGWTVLR